MLITTNWLLESFALIRPTVLLPAFFLRHCVPMYDFWSVTQLHSTDRRVGSVWYCCHSLFYTYTGFLYVSSVPHLLARVSRVFVKQTVPCACICGAGARTVVPPAGLWHPRFRSVESTFRETLRNHRVNYTGLSWSVGQIRRFARFIGQPSSFVCPVQLARVCACLHVFAGVYGCLRVFAHIF